MANQAASGAPLPPRTIPPKKHAKPTALAGNFFIRHQRQDDAQLTLLQDRSYTPIADSWMDLDKIMAKGRKSVVGNVEEPWIDDSGIRVEQHGCRYAPNTAKRDKCTFLVWFEMAKILDIRLAEFEVDRVFVTQGDPDNQQTAKVPTIEISFRYEDKPVGEATYAAVPKNDTKEGEVEAETGEEAEEGEVGAGDAEGSPVADPMDADLEEVEAAAGESDPETFDSTDPNEFPLAKAFSDKPDPAFEVRLRFRKPSPQSNKKGIQWWYWPAACGLLAGLESYRPPVRKGIVEAQREWTLDTWIEKEGQHRNRFPHAKFERLDKVPGEDIQRWRLERALWTPANRPGPSQPAAAPQLPQRPGPIPTQLPPQWVSNIHTQQPLRYPPPSIPHPLSQSAQKRPLEENAAASPEMFDWSQQREQSRATLQVREMQVAQEETEVSIEIQDLTAQLSRASLRQQKALQSRRELELDKKRYQEKDDELVARLPKRDEGARSPKRQKGSGEGSGGDVEMGAP